MEWWIDASAWVLPVVLAITLHEAAHGFVAERFGDDTARRAGRVTFNPLKHIDRVGTLLLPALLMLAKSPVLFGYAKPVPVDYRRLTPWRQGVLCVALAGVAVNLMLAVASGVLLHVEAWITPEEAPWLFMNLYRSLLINCVLIVFNLIPILPLDGGRAVDALLPEPARKIYGATEKYGIVLVLGALLGSEMLGLGLAEIVIGVPAFWLMEQVLYATGNGF